MSRLPDPPPTPWGARCSLRLPSGAQCGAARVALPTATTHERIAEATYQPAAPRIVLCCLSCDFGAGNAVAGPPRFVAHIRRGGA